ncbi:MAG: hypothetical protein FJX57_15950 [Alphaproteobacteria bacterium]|nr:hypothetical protein [Alphaproteobacteria bacterium]
MFLRASIRKKGGKKHHAPNQSYTKSRTHPAILIAPFPARLPTQVDITAIVPNIKVQRFSSASATRTAADQPTATSSQDPPQASP